ncbi:hypothetical protein Avi_3013 [Allorhizobium ampelinum S4]|uniref:Uncharacterized protein n=1 Tax=Allorhizobium ampelinum (strain ATCC BAA-846 / DSM 112012 / S4) TaxID=311402 RepID=B9JYE4_ALLAM|nr:hypothetical protein Avi_3013 [Allorhizobium ampelinum S4]
MTTGGVSALIEQADAIAANATSAIIGQRRILFLQGVGTLIGGLDLIASRVLRGHGLFKGLGNLCLGCCVRFLDLRAPIVVSLAAGRFGSLVDHALDLADRGYTAPDDGGKNRKGNQTGDKVTAHD